MAHSYGLDIPDDLYERIEDAREKGQWKNDWIFGAIRLRLELEDAAEAAGMADDLDEWAANRLYPVAREDMAEQRERAAAEAQAEGD